MSDQLIGTDVTALLQAKKNSRLFSRAPGAENASVGLFLAQLLGWAISKILGVFSFFLGFLVNLEKSLINLRVETLQLFYWGRGNIFALFLQAILIFVVTAIGFTFVVGQGIQGRIISQYSSDPIQVYAAAPDTVVESGSLITSMPKELKRSETIDYVVTYDDTLGAKALDNIAADFEITADSIRWANNFSKTYQPKPGTTIKIPPVAGSLYTVQSGDSLDSISSRFKLDKLTIMEINFLAGDARLNSGQQLFLPGVAPQVAVVVKKKVGSKSYLLYGSVGGNFTAPAGPKFLSWPIASSNISRCFSSYHDGIDIIPSGSGSSNPTVMAAAAGRVTYAGLHCSPGWWGTPCGGYAWVVEIDHGNGFSTLYGHLYPNSIMVGVGDAVTRGQALAKMGTSGTSTGTHTHFQLNHGGFLGKSSLQAVNPAKYLSDSHGCR